MNINHIITGLNDGGAEAVLYRLCVHDKKHHHIVISMMDEGKYGSLLQAAGVTVHCLNMPRGRVTVSGMVQLYRLLRSIRPDVVQTWMYHADLIGGVVARLAGVKRVFWGIHHSNLESGKVKNVTRLIARICGVLSLFVPRTIVCCAHQAADVHAKLGYVKNKMVIIGNGYDLDHFIPNTADRDQLRAEWGIAESIPVLGMVGRFDPQKDHKNLIDALALLKRSGLDFRCALVGKDISVNNHELSTWINDQNLKNQLLLLEQRNDIPAVMNALDIHVLSSLGEAFPNVIAEAMASGTPCVTTDVGDAALIVDDTGWVVPPKDSQALAQAISTAIEERQKNPEVWRMRKQAARNRIVENFSIEKMIASYHDVWDRSSRAIC